MISGARMHQHRLLVVLGLSGLVMLFAHNRVWAKEPSIIRVSAGSGFSLALDSKGGVWAWGTNSAGQLGAGAITYSPTPLRVIDASDPTGFLSHVVAISAGSSHALALKDDGTVWAWGANPSGNLGDGTQTNRSSPVQVLDPLHPSGLLHGVVAVEAGSGFSMFLKEDTTLLAVGANEQGQLGDGTIVNQRLTVIRVVDRTDPTGHLTGIRAIGAGSAFAVALKMDGTVRAWGRNTVGQTGDGTTTVVPRPMPVRVTDIADPTGFLTSVTKISAGSSTGYALKADGSVRAWGFNGNGQIGDGTLFNRSTAVLIPALTQVTSLDAGTFFCLAVRSNGTSWAWGSNSSGEIGDGTMTDRVIPVQVLDSRRGRAFRGVASLSAGSTHSLAVTDDGAVRSWGSYGLGQLGNGSVAVRPLAVQVVSGVGSGFLTGIRAVSSAGGVSMALTSDLKVLAWGANNFGQLGDGTTINRIRPGSVLDPTDPTGLLTNISTLGAGNSHTLAAAIDGTVRAWGLGTSGQLGDGTGQSRRFPIYPSGLGGVLAVSAGSSHSLATKGDGTVSAWGDNDFGQLGDGTTSTRLTAVPVRDSLAVLGGVTQVAAGGGHSLALLANGSVKAWGQNSAGQLGDGSQGNNRLFAVSVGGATPLTGVTAIAAGGAFSLALHGDGTVWAWGTNSSGQLGDGTTSNRNVPQRVLDPVDQTGYLTGVIAISAGAIHGSALKSNGTVRTWGNNGAGQLGDGTLVPHSVPVGVLDNTGLLSDVHAISAGADHMLALRTDGTVWAWGSNSVGQVGDGTIVNSLTPVKVLFSE